MRRRFILALIFAILPFALLAAGQAAWRLMRAEAESRQDLIEAAHVSSSQESNFVARAEALLNTLGNLPDVVAGGDECSKLLAGVVIDTPYAGIVRLDANGQITCASRPFEDRNRSDLPYWKAVRDRRTFIISEQYVGRTSNRPIITAAIPIVDAGAFKGALAVGIPVDFLTETMRQRRMSNDTVAVLIDADGKIIAASDMALANLIFAGAVIKPSEDLRDIVSQTGEQWRYASAAVHDQDLFIAFARRGSALLGWDYLDFAFNIALPVLMAIFAFLAIWLAADRFVLRWVAYLQRVARAYGSGHLGVRPDAQDAPFEIQQLAGAMGDMADNLRTRDASLRHALEQRKMMTREIHHRVKNNLQVVASLLQIESRRLAEPAAREALRVTHTRINAIALVHRILEEIEDRTVVNVRTLIAELSRLLQDAFAGEHHREPIRIDAEDQLLETDAAVPLALYLVEQVAEIYGSIPSQQNSLGLSIALVRDEGRFILRVTYRGEGITKPYTGPDFVGAYVRQLDGTLSRKKEQDLTVVSLSFPERWAINPSPSVKEAR